MKWFEKHWVRKKEMVKVMGELGPGKRSTAKLANIVYEVRRFHRDTKAVRPTERAVDGAMYRSLRATGVIMERGETERNGGRKRRIIVYSKSSTT
jgi:hypothetical protein